MKQGMYEAERRELERQNKINEGATKINLELEILNGEIKKTLPSLGNILSPNVNFV